jgi:hypothetical protein
MPPVGPATGHADWRDGHLRCAPLDANVNDKGCAFGAAWSR